MAKQLTKQDCINYIKSLSKSELLEFLKKWHNAENNPNWREIQTWTRKQIAQCIITDIELERA